MKFEYPEIEVVKFAVEDIITDSATDTTTETTKPTPPDLGENTLGWS